jgi:hypothetical protein
MVSRSSAARSLLDNADVVTYLKDLDSLENFDSERSLHRTNSPKFRAEIVALGEGMLEDEVAETTPFLFSVDALPDEPGETTAAQATAFPVRFEPAAENAPEDKEEPAGPDGQLSLIRTVLFLLAMMLLGASSAAVLFHERLFLILGF